MKFSIITPTHNIKHIPELYQSILEQTYTDWEWIILLNGVDPSTIPHSMLVDPKVKIYSDDTGNKNVGYLKNVAFHKGTGDVLVEVDHDDILMPICLEKMVVPFNMPQIGFVYSDNAKLQTNGTFTPYSSEFGWSMHNMPYREGFLPVMEGFEPSFGSMAFISYMPDHVRAWRASVYRELGGHNVDYSVLDDHELIVRTYLVTEFYYIREPLYIYRITGDNTWLANVEKIQKGTYEIFKQYAYQIAERQADLLGKMKVDLGGGIDKRVGYTSIDQFDGDITADLNQGIPLPDNSVGVINASHVLEHLKDPFKSMSEIYRVLCDGGVAFIDVPSTDGRGAYMDPTHVSFWNQNSFWYYTRRDQARYIRNNTVKFQTFRLETHFPNEWWRENNIPITTAWLVALKSGAKRPHPINI